MAAKYIKFLTLYCYCFHTLLSFFEDSFFRYAQQPGHILVCSMHIQNIPVAQNIETSVVLAKYNRVSGFTVCVNR